MGKANLEYTVLESEYLHKDPPWFTVRKEHVQLPNGSEIPAYYILEYPDWINVLGVTTDNKIIMIRQYRHALHKTCYELPAGVCDDTDKNPLASAKREMMEETGYGGGHWEKWMELSANPATHSNITHCYLATNLERIAEQNLEPTEQMTVHLFSIEEVKGMLINNEIWQALHAAPLWKYLYQHTGNTK